MTYTLAKTFTVDRFIAEYGDDYRYELADGEPIDREPTGLHETVSGKLATQIGIAIINARYPWFIPRTCLIQPFAELATARRPDIIVLDETLLGNEPLWQRQPVITIGRSIKLVVEVVSTNWETDYARKVEEYAVLGIPEYWIELEVMPDHVHLLVECDPQFGIAKLIRYMKGRSSRLLRQEFPWLKSRLPTLWTNSYFVSTVGGAPIAVIKKYIEDQKSV